jgi:arginyl-tRNA synthetase
LKYHNEEAVPTTNKGAWIGSMYSKGHLLLEDEKGTDKEEANRKQLSEILTQLEHQEGEFYDLWKETREWSIQQMQEVYDWAGASFDVWYWESEVDVPSVELVREYQKKGTFTESQGAVIADLEEDKLGVCVLIKSDGHGLYATKDIELARRKFESWNIEKSLYVVDKRQSHHFKQVFCILGKMGFEHASKCHHIEYDYVELPDGAMSSRKGNIVPIMKLISGMEDLVKEQYLNNYQGEWSEEEINKTASVIAQGAIKYGMLRIDTNKKIVFDMKEWLRLDGESGVYIQYTYARISSLLKKHNYVRAVDSLHEVPWNFVEPQEEAVVLYLSGFNTAVENAAIQYKPSLLTAYLYDTAKLFNTMYNAVSIKNTSDEQLKLSRLALADAVGNILKEGLGVLGIPVPSRM